MAMSMASSHAVYKRLNDAIFAASDACRAAIEHHGSENVVNATIGVMMNENGNFACLPTVEKVYRELPIDQIANYAPIIGIPEYRDLAIDLTFADNRPDGYFTAVATAGGTGAVHHAIMNYAEKGDGVLTSDWYWGTYKVICEEEGCRLSTFKLFDENNNFNIEDFRRSVEIAIDGQDSLLVIINSPANNPTGFALTNDDWDQVIDTLAQAASQGRRISLLVDIAYIDYAGEKNETRKFMQKFSGLPKNVLVMFAFSMSKSFTFYGQRTGALVAFSTDESVIQEFLRINKYSCRATWSNINRGAQTLMVKLCSDQIAYKQFLKEREDLYNMVEKRGELFMKDARECGLPALPYNGGFFLSVPTKNANKICDRLHEDLIFAVPLKLGIRIACCSMSMKKLEGVAKKIKKAYDEAGE